MKKYKGTDTRSIFVDYEYEAERKHFTGRPMKGYVKGQMEIFYEPEAEDFREFESKVEKTVKRAVVEVIVADPNGYKDTSTLFMLRLRARYANMQKEEGISLPGFIGGYFVAKEEFVEGKKRRKLSELFKKKEEKDKEI
ncbi:MAG: hypothetical protein E7375_00470 [Clostridiales bacterium]|nr:hypothetical protein [Clostridiales bacterium]